MLGELYLEMGNVKEAEDFFNKAVLISREINARMELAAAYYNLGVLYKGRNDKSKSREYLRRAQEIYRLIDIPSYQRVKSELTELNSLP
jgi:tetratricopeptide (TPR) repeat protein